MKSFFGGVAPIYGNQSFHSSSQILQNYSIENSLQRCILSEDSQFPQDSLSDFSKLTPES